MVDLKDVIGAPEGRNQWTKLLPIIETMNFEPDRQQTLIDAAVVNRERLSNGWSLRMQKSD